MRHPIDPIRAAVLHHLGSRTRNRRGVLFPLSVTLTLCTLRAVVALAQPAAPPPPVQATGPMSAAPASRGPAPVAPPQVDKGSDSFDFAQALGQGEVAMSADQVADLAVKTGPTVAKAQAVGDQARKAASQALVAVYPRLDLLAQYTRLSPPPPLSFQFTGTNPMTGAMQTTTFSPRPGRVDLFLLEARVSYPVSDLFFQILPRYEAAKEAAKAQDLRTKAEVQSVALQARETFYNYARARAALLVARSGLAQTGAQLRDVESLVRAGTLARVEQMRAEAQVAASRVAVARAEGSVAVARTALRTLLHRAGEQDIAVGEDFSQALPNLAEDKEQLLAAAMQNRSELRALETMTGVNDRNVRASNADKLPKLSVAATGDLADPNQRATSYQNKFTGTWALMGMLTWSPNDFASADARAAQVGAQRAQTLADIAALEDALRREVGQAYEDYNAAHQAMEAALTGIQAAEESYRVRREQFRAGAAVATDVIIAEGDLNRARLDLINASIDLRIARARLDRAVERGQVG